MKLEIENFRSIRQEIIDFNSPKGTPSPVFVLGGPNGSGKTTVLEAVLLAASHPELVIGPKSMDALRAGQTRGSIRAEFRLPDRSVWTEVIFRPDSKPEQVWESRSGIKGTEQPFDVPCTYFSSWRAPRLVGSLSVTAGKWGKRPADTEYNRLWNAKQYIINAKAHAQMGKGSNLETSKYQEIIERLKETWQLFYRTGQQEFGVEPISDDPESGFDVFLCGPGDRKVSVDFLSSGQLEVFVFAASLLRGNSQAGIVCIDEPEMHLDPQWHAVMLRAIRKLQPEMQILAATHSPRIYDTTLSTERCFLVSEEDPRATTWK
ncbi:MAG: AAA family ATPase [Deltaproteobacteria bacterium]|nr:AAA family ATPase [Deltaproteobacteria bacterium]